MSVNRAKYINSTSRRLWKKGGRQGKNFLTMVTLPLADIVEAVMKENVTLMTRLEEAREESMAVHEEKIDLKRQLGEVREESAALCKSNHSLQSQVTFCPTEINRMWMLRGNVSIVVHSHI